MGERRLGEVQGAEVFELSRVVVFVPESGSDQIGAVEDALIREVVNGIDARASVQWATPLDGVHVHRHERGLPIVRVHDVRDPTERGAELERAPRQKGEAVEVVRIVAAGRAVEIRTIEVLVVLEEVDRHLAPRQSAEPDTGTARCRTTSAPRGCLRGSRTRATACRRTAASRHARRRPVGAAPWRARRPRRRGRRSSRMGRTPT